MVDQTSSPVPGTTLVVHSKPQSNAQSTKTCNFLKVIPPEVRNAIYELVLAFNLPINLYYPRDGAHYGPSGNSNKEFMNIVNTCKKIREEALPIFFSQNIFRIAATSRWPRECGVQALHNFLDDIGLASRRCLKSLRFSYSFCQRNDLQWPAPAFELLGDCTGLSHLEIGVTRRTTFGTRQPQENLTLAKGMTQLRAVLKRFQTLNVVVNDWPHPPQVEGTDEENWFSTYQIHPKNLQELQQMLQDEVDKDVTSLEDAGRVNGR